MRRPATRVPSRSVTVLTIMAAATWAAVWWIEHGRGGEHRDAVMARADVPQKEGVVR